MRAKIVNFVSKGDTEAFEIIKEALILYDEYLHSNNDIPRAIKVRALLNELGVHRNKRII